MINKNTVKRYCSEPFDLIENYGLAINSEETWECHHRMEIQDGKLISREELIDQGMYYGRPASELIFLRRSEHSALHGKVDRRRIKKWNEAGVKAASSHETIAKRSTAILQFTKSGDFVKEFVGIRAAERETGIAGSGISRCAKGEYESAGGFRWRYK